MRNSFWRTQYKVRNCNNTGCKIYDTNEPICLTHIHPSQIRILIITEQPKIKKGIAVTNINFYHVVNNSSTVNSLERLLGIEFGKSIANRSGSYYWTHHTKCSHKNRQQQQNCAENILLDEIRSFQNLSLVLSFGSEVFWHFYKNNLINGSFKGDNFFDYYYEILLEQRTNIPHEFYLEIGSKKIIYLPLSHPSSQNPLSNMNYKVIPLIRKYCEKAIQY